MPPITHQLRSFTGYAGLPGHHDEMITSEGAVREHWNFLKQAMEHMGLAELFERQREARRILKQNGVTYNIYDGEERGDRTWSLDPIPLVLSSSQWSQIEQGLLQRAEIFDFILKDIYGPQDLIRRGVLPAEAVYSHPGFIRAAHNLAHPANHLLMFYAVDLARTPDGHLIAMADRAQAPSGSGYALENRLVLSRTLPSLFRDAQVHRLAVYYRAVRQALQGLAPTARDEPRIVVLTPGPDNETYFEHAFLANYLGYPLVQGQDLTVLDGRLWLKTLEGNQQVDVLLRRMDDTWCDPLELRPDSLIGTPGLLQAARLNNVTVVNPPGSGVLDNPALLPYLERICKHLLGQSLRLPSVPTYWCGDGHQRDYVLNNLDRLIIKTIFPSHRSRSIFAADLNENARRDLIAAIHSYPYHYVGQEQVSLSCLPTLVPDGLEPRPMILRTFLVGRENDYVVMPGGLTRVAPDADSPIVSNQRGGISKDTWVITSEPGQRISLLSTREGTPAIARSPGAVASRVANNMYWLGRYTERSENLIRLLREILNMQLAEDLALASGTRAVLLQSLKRMTLTPTTYNESVDTADANLRETMALIFNHERPGSLAHCIQSLLFAGRHVQDRLSDDAWRFLNQMEQELRPDSDLDRILESFDRILLLLSAFAGLSQESMSRGQGWRFLNMGRRVERSLNTLALLETVYAEEVERDPWLLETLLSIKDSLRTYRQRYNTRFNEELVLDLLLLDEMYPQSVAFQLNVLQEDYRSLPGHEGNYFRTPEERCILETLTALRMTDAHQVSGTRLSIQEGGLFRLLNKSTHNIRSFSDEITRKYLAADELPRSIQT